MRSRQPSIPFRPPGNPHLPMIMVGAGTGMAPFRGFLQERESLRAKGVPIATSLLFLGCRDRDWIGPGQPARAASSTRTTVAAAKTPCAATTGMGRVCSAGRPP